MANRQNDQSVTQRFASLGRCCLEPCAVEDAPERADDLVKGVDLVFLWSLAYRSYCRTRRHLNLKVGVLCQLVFGLTAFHHSSGGCPACLCACFVPYRERLTHRAQEQEDIDDVRFMVGDADPR